jgi:hypothetical protein
MAIMIYALVTFHWRATAIRNKGSGPYDDRLGEYLAAAKPAPPALDLIFSTLLSRSYRLVRASFDRCASQFHPALPGR